MSDANSKWVFKNWMESMECESPRGTIRYLNGYQGEYE